MMVGLFYFLEGQTLCLIAWFAVSELYQLLSVAPERKLSEAEPAYIEKLYTE
jgi:hypothetical protein